MKNKAGNIQFCKQDMVIAGYNALYEIAVYALRAYSLYIKKESRFITPYVFKAALFMIRGKASFPQQVCVSKAYFLFLLRLAHPSSSKSGISPLKGRSS